MSGSKTFLNKIFIYYHRTHSEGICFASATWMLFVRSILLPSRKSLFFWESPPSKYPPRILWQLGLSRCYLALSRLHCKPAKLSSTQFQQDCIKGYKFIPKLLDSRLIDQILSSCESDNTNTRLYLEDFSEFFIYDDRPDSIFHYSEHYLTLRDNIVQQLALSNLYHNLTGKPPFISVITHTSIPDAKYERFADGNSIPHYDVPYNSFKLFVYLTSVSKDDAPFCYYPCTHNIPPLAYEHDCDTFFEMQNKGYSKPIPAFTSAEPIIFTGSPGDALWFNVSGIHRRGDFKLDKYRERKVLLVDFRRS
jgi:hypothetical protein